MKESRTMGLPRLVETSITSLQTFLFLILFVVSLKLNALKLCFCRDMLQCVFL